jgi:hypothetical protein
MSPLFTRDAPVTTTTNPFSIAIPNVESDETPLCSRHFHIESQLALCPGNVLGKPLGWIT